MNGSTSRNARGRVGGWRLGVLLLAAGLGIRAQNVANNFKVPDIKDGVLQSLFMGERAKMAPGEPMLIDGLTIEFYDEEGKEVRMTITSPHTAYDDRKGIARSDAPIRIVGETFEVTGKKYVYERDAERLEIFHNVKVVLKNLNTPESGADPEEEATE